MQPSASTEESIALDDPDLNSAAVKIQSVQRGKSGRKEFQEKHAAAQSASEQPAVAAVVEQGDGEDDEGWDDTEYEELRARLAKKREELRKRQTMLEQGETATRAAEFMATVATAEPEEEIDLDDPDLNEAALKIQAVQRGKTGRREFEQKKSAEILAAEKAAVLTPEDIERRAAGAAEAEKEARAAAASVARPQ